MMFLPFLLGAAIGTINAQQTNNAPFGRGCLVPSIDSPEAKSQAEMVSALRTDKAALPCKIDVDVHFHIASTVNDTNLITQEILDAQWKVLHDTYAANNINLALKSTDRIVNDRAGQYFLVDESTDEYPNYVNYPEEKEEYLTSTRKGGYDALNIYFFSRYLPGATGYCSYPEPGGANNTKVLGLDGCAVSGLTMPGIKAEDGGNVDYDQGHVAVHESGHWFGLNHTFVGGCSSPTGDFVDDTPAQRSEVYDCPIGLDSCPDSPGVDPIHNFMGYTNDKCTSEFTPGQQARMFATFFGFRRSA